MFNFFFCKEFQSLIGILQIILLVRLLGWFKKFQSLIGILQMEEMITYYEGLELLFQSLIGILQILEEFLRLDKMVSVFQSLIGILQILCILSVCQNQLGFNPL